MLKLKAGKHGFQNLHGLNNNKHVFSHVGQGKLCKYHDHI